MVKLFLYTNYTGGHTSQTFCYFKFVFGYGSHNSTQWLNNT